MSWAAWCCMVPWLMALRRASAVSGALYGLAYGIFYALPCTWSGIYTACVSLGTTGLSPAAVVVLFYLPYIVPHILFGAYRGLFSPGGMMGAVSSAAVFTTVIYLAPTVFPVTPAVMLHNQAVPIQVADLGGMPLLNFLLILVNLLIEESTRQLRNGKQPRKAAVCLAGVALFVGGYGMVRIHLLNAPARDGENREIGVALIQPNLPPGIGEKGFIRDNPVKVRSALELTRRAVAGDESIDLVVWPEASSTVSCAKESRIYKTVSDLARQTGVSLIYHCMDCSGGDDGNCFNAVRLVSPKGETDAVYRKQALVPFTETLPDNWFYRLFTHFAPDKKYLTRGDTPAIFHLDEGVRVLPLICYDVHFPGRVRQAGKADLLVVVANDQRFGRSRIGYMDHAMTIFRAVETRRPLVRVTNTGPSAVIRADGSVVPGSLTPVDRHTFRTAALETAPLPSPYSRKGDLLLLLIWFWTAADVVRKGVKLRTL